MAREVPRRELPEACALRRHHGEPCEAQRWLKGRRSLRAVTRRPVDNSAARFQNGRRDTRRDRASGRAARSGTTSPPAERDRIDEEPGFVHKSRCDEAVDHGDAARDHDLPAAVCYLVLDSAQSAGDGTTSSPALWIAYPATARRAAIRNTHGDQNCCFLSKA